MGYGFTGEMAEDAAAPAVRDAYIDSKGSAAEVLALARGAIRSRGPAIYGPGSVPWTIRPLEAMRSKCSVGCGDGLMIVYVDDLVDAILVSDGRRAAPTPFRDGEAVMPAMLLPPRPHAWARRAAEPAGAAGGGRRAGARGDRPPPRPAALGPAALTYISRRGTYPNTRAREELGWEPEVGLAEAAPHGGVGARPGCSMAETAQP